MFTSPNASSATIVIVVSVTFAAAAVSAMPPYSEWQAPLNINGLPASAANLNTAAVDGCVSLSRNGLIIYFNSNRPGSQDQDIYVAERSNTAEGFSSPQRLPATINTPATEFCPTIVGRNTLYFSRSRAGDLGDIYVSKRSNLGWSAATRLGDNVNSPLMDESAAVFDDNAGREVLLFSRRTGDASQAGGQIFQSVEGGPAAVVAGGPNSAGSNNRPSITHDGRTIFFDSTRTGGLGGPDLWFATRDSTADSFGAAYHPYEVNSPGFDARPFVTWDGTQLFFSSNRAGSVSPAPDIWMTQRAKSRGPKVVEFPASD